MTKLVNIETTIKNACKRYEAEKGCDDGKDFETSKIRILEASFFRGRYPNGSSMLYHLEDRRDGQKFIVTHYIPGGIHKSYGWHIKEEK